MAISGDEGHGLGCRARRFVVDIDGAALANIAGAIHRGYCADVADIVSEMLWDAPPIELLIDGWREQCRTWRHL
jgi:hypothetical protein